ncbi:MAG: VOC family protein [Bacteroidota bacterium]|nr:VOC family protein [Bacteroidota bacterium]
MKKFISGIQQLGVGIPNVHEAWAWYRKMFGMDIPVVDAPGTAELMLPYTGNKPHDRHAIIAINIQGGGGFEIWQYLSREPQPAKFEIQLGDLGIFIGKVKSKNIKAAYENIKLKGGELLSDIHFDPAGQKTFFVKDPYGNIFQLVANEEVFKETEAYTAGTFGAVIGVSDIEKSKEFYSEVLGYDKVIYDETDVYSHLRDLPGGNKKVRRCLLTHSKPRKGPFSNLFGSSQIELVQSLEYDGRKIYADRLWGDLGFIHLCFDVQNMKAFKENSEKYSIGFSVDSNPESYESNTGTFDMGAAAGHFTYTEDPDGTLIEFVETHKMPIVEKLGWSMNLKKRTPGKPIPSWMLKTLAWNRKKD